MDQVTLALVANVAVRSIHRVENGEPTIRFDVLSRILDALGLELEVRARSGESVLGSTGGAIRLGCWSASTSTLVSTSFNM